MLDPDMAVHAVKGQREHPCAEQDEHDEGREPRGRGQRLCDHGEVQPPLDPREEKRTHRPHRAALGGCGDAEEDRAQHEEDQRKRRDQHDDDLLRQPRHELAARGPVEDGGDVDHRDPGHSAKDVRVLGPVGAREPVMRGHAHARRHRQRHDQRHDARAQRARLERQRRHRLRLQDRHDEHIAHVDPGEDQAGDQRPLVHVAHRPAELVGQHDQHEARRDDLRQRAGGRDDPRGDAAIVAVAQHDRQRDQPHGDDRGRDDARGGRKKGAHDDDRIGQPAADRPEELADRVEQVLGHAGSLQHDAHEGEEGNGEQRLVREHPQNRSGMVPRRFQPRLIVPSDSGASSTPMKKNRSPLAASAKATG